MKTLRNAPFHSPALVSSLSIILLLGSGCGDSREVAELKTKIAAMETKQRELDSKLAAMGEQIVTKRIEVQGPLKAKFAELSNLQVDTLLSRGSIRVGDGAGKGSEGKGPSQTIIYPWKLEISNLSSESKDGHISTLDAASLRITDYDGKSGIFGGNGVMISVKGTRKMLSRSNGNENKFEVWSEGNNENLRVIRNLWNEVPLKTDASFATNKLVNAVNYLSAGGGGYGTFGAKVTGITDDGVVRIQMANVSPLAVTDVTGVLEWMGTKGKTGEVSFAIDRRMETGSWHAFSVPTGVPREQLLFLTLRDIHVRSTFFTTRVGN